MTKDVYATSEESARVIKPDTRAAAEKALHKLQSEQTHDFEQGHEIDNGAIALKLIEQNVELLGALNGLLYLLDDGTTADPDESAVAFARHVAAKHATK